MSKCTIYHNPRCTKSRAALQLLEEHGIEPKVIPYLIQPPSKADLKRLINLLGLRPREIFRRSEPIARTLNLDLNDDRAVLDAMAEHPVLIERPIVVYGDRAVIARPADKVLELIDEVD